MALGQHVFGAERLQAFSDAVFAIITTIMVSHHLRWSPFSSQTGLGLGLATLGLCVNKLVAVNYSAQCTGVG